MGAPLLGLPKSIYYTTAWRYAVGVDYAWPD